MAECNCGECRMCDPHFEERLIVWEKEHDNDAPDWSPYGGYREGDSELEDLKAEYGPEDEYTDESYEEWLNGADDDDGLGWDYVPTAADIADKDVPF